jgi:hypothetical protein
MNVGWGGWRKVVLMVAVYSKKNTTRIVVLNYLYTYLYKVTLITSSVVEAD